jgi:DNA-binding CsgD family transcriptional regulator
MSPVLVGRGAELELLRAAVSRSPSVTIVHGEAGIGKTRLVAELLADPAVEKDAWRVLVGRCHRIQEPFPLAPVIESLRALERDAGRLELSPLTGALRPLLPELSRVLPAALEPLGDRVAERHRVFRALTEILGALGKVVIVLEDLHWIDDQTLEFLRHLLADPPEGVALVITYRGLEAAASVGALTARLPPTMRRQDIPLLPLGELETGALAAAILDTADIPPDFAGYLRERTSGLPFAIEEVLALLRERGHVVRGGWLWAHRVLDELEVPRALADSVLERATRLSPAARAIAEAAAVLHVAARQRVVVATSGHAARAAQPGLEEAIASGLLVDHDGAIGFAHVLAAEAIEDALPGPRRRALHARAAAALEREDRPPLGQLAHHLERSGQLDEWARCAEEAANQAADLGDDAEAARLLTNLIERASLDPPARARVALKLAHSALFGMAQAEVLRVLDTALEDPELPRVTRGELRFAVARLRLQGGDQSLVQFEQAVAELEGRPVLRARAMSRLMLPFGAEVPIQQHLAWMERAVELLEEIDDPLVEAAVTGDRATLLLLTGDRRWRGALAGLPAETASLEQQREVLRGLANVAGGACYVGHYGVAEILLERGLRDAERPGHERIGLYVRVVRAMLQFSTGRWKGLERVVESLFDELDPLPAHGGELAWMAGALALARGDLAGAGRRLEDALQNAERSAVVGEELAPCAGALARVELARSGPEAALSAAMRGLSFLRAKAWWAPAGPAVVAAVEALVATGRRAEANALVEHFAAGIRDADAPLAAAALLVCRGVVAAASGSQQDGADRLLAAAAAYASLPCPYEAAQANERAARCMFSTGDERAGRLLLDALEVYHGLGATWDAKRCARTGRSRGLSLPKPYRGGRRGYGPRLSPRELEVARLAASGLSNKAIAQRLFLAPKTVENCLGRVMTKLDVRSRAAIGGRLDPPGITSTRSPSP